MSLGEDNCPYLLKKKKKKRCIGNKLRTPISQIKLNFAEVKRNNKRMFSHKWRILGKRVVEV